MKIDGYVLVRRDRGNGKRGEGVCQFIRDTLFFTERCDLNNDLLEAKWIDLSLKSEKITIGCVYRPPNSDMNYFNSMLGIFEKASMDNYDIVVLGDLNYDYNIDDDNPINLLENLFSLRQMILKPTRVTSTSSKCLDHILSSIPDKHLISDVAKIALSDHYLIYTCINLQKEVKVKHKVVRFRDYQNFDEKTFIQDLTNCLNLNDILTSNLSVNEMWTKWKTSFDEVCNSHAPMKECRVKDRHNPWITSDVVKLMYKRDHLKKKYDKLKLPHILSEYRRTRNNVTKVIKNKKRKYFSTVTEKYKGDSKKLWKEINKFIGRKSTNTDIPNNLNGDDFNEYFVNIGKQISDSFQNEIFIWNHPDSTYTFAIAIYMLMTLLYIFLIRISKLLGISCRLI